MTTESQGLRSVDYSRPTELKPQPWNTVSILSGTTARDIPQGADTASQHLPSVTIGDSTKLAEQPKPKPAENGDQQVGNTTLKRDSSGNTKEYDNGDYSLAKHDDGKWYYNQKGSSTYVEVDGNSIKMDDQGKVTYNESGFLGKDNQTLGNGSTGFLSSVTSAASHVKDAVVEHPLDTFNKIAFMPEAALDAVAGTHTIKAIGELEKGAANEVIHHPGEILKDVAIGAAIGIATVATGGGALVAIGLGAAALATTELVKNKGNLSGVVDDAEAFGSTVAGWGNDFATVAGTGQHSQQEEAAAEQGLQQMGAFGAQTAAGIAGGMAGEAGAAAAGLEGAIPKLAGNVASKFKPEGESPPHGYDIPLSSDEHGALLLMKGDRGYEINAHLRAKMRLPEGIQGQVDALDSAIARAPAFDQPVTLYRGHPFGESLEEAEQAIAAGKIDVDLGYRSTSASPDIANAFARNQGVIYQYEVPAGVRAIKQPPFIPKYDGDGITLRDESEYLFPRGSQWKYTNALIDEQGQVVIKADYVPPAS